MKIAVFGGSGFLGTAFVRTALGRGGVELVVYTSSGARPAVPATARLDVRPYVPDRIGELVLDPDTDVIVNFAHPFERRGTLSGADQIRQFAHLVDRAKQSNHALRLIHLSSMSVFEPFRQNQRFDEAEPLQPPRNDRYAQEKVAGETVLRALRAADEWQLHLRPTVVYGPLCRPWTNRILTAFERGDVGFTDLSGRVQPIYGDDVAEFVSDRLFDFSGGIYNVAGPEEMPWLTFFKAFETIVGRGRLIQVAAEDVAADDQPTFHQKVIRRSARLLAKPLPAGASRALTGWIERRATSSRAATADANGIDTTFLCRPYFAEDRLVNDTKWRRDFPAFPLRRFADTTASLTEYYRQQFRGGLAR